METYTQFAAFYDYMLRHVDYDRWYRYIRSIMLHYIKRPEIILELGCGTGKFGAKFSKDDFTIFGMDNSIDMLKMAKFRAFKNFRIFCGDLRNFSISKKADFIFSVHDTMNYLLRYSDIRETLQSVRSVMHSGSIFMFDITTEHNIRKFFDKKVKQYVIRNTNIEWKNRYDEERRLIHSLLTFKMVDGSILHEEHIQRIYSVNEMKKLLSEEGFAVKKIFSDYSFSPVSEDTVMINFVTSKRDN